MPTVINGIGTWYYGKDRVHRRKDACGFCNGVGELASYDTTLYFVVFFIPLVPLGRKRILDECPYCQKHRLVPLAQWEEAKAGDTARMLEALARDPEDRDTILGALSLAMTYQDETLFNKLADTLARHRKDDAAIQAQLAYGHSFFARYPEAEQAFRASLAAEANPAVRRDLGWVLLKQLRPEEARPYLQHILDQKLGEDAGLIYLLIEAYQAQGLHKEALSVMDQRDAAFPELAKDKDAQKQRKTSERYLDSGKPIKPVLLGESGRAGYREGGAGTRVAKVVGPLLLLAALAVYLGAALWIGQSRKVYVVNGWDRPYTVAINGHEHTLPPGVATPVRVAEGEVRVESRDPRATLEAVVCRVETPFFSRPFANRTFVLNPDRLAVVVWQQAEYAAAPRPPSQPKVHVGKGLYGFEGVDYEFTPFPPTVQIKRDRTVTKTRVGLEADLMPEVRLGLLAALVEEAEQFPYVQRWLRLDPDNELALYWLQYRVKEDEALAFLRPGLAERPLRGEWHRAYQNLMNRAHPEQDLRPDYQKLVAELNENAEAVYLLGRVLPTEEADQFFRQAAAAKPPSPYAVHALGWDALARGQFTDAVAWAEKALQLAPRQLAFQHTQESALLAAGQYERLLEVLQERYQGPRLNTMFQIDRVRILAVKGDKVGAEAAVQQVLAGLARPEDAPARELLRAELDLARCCALHDAEGYLRAAAGAPDTTRFEVAFLEGKWRDAAAAAGVPRGDLAEEQHGLLFLAARKAGDQELAEEQWQKLVDSLSRAGPQSSHHLRRLAQMLAGRTPLDLDVLRRLPQDPKEKRIVLAAVAHRFPEQAKDLLELARKLDYQRDGLSLCLRRVLD